MKRETFDIIRLTVERLMLGLGFEGVRCGKKMKTTKGAPIELCSLDNKMNREFRANLAIARPFARTKEWLQGNGRGAPCLIGIRRLAKVIR